MLEPGKGEKSSASEWNRLSDEEKIAKIWSELEKVITREIGKITGGRLPLPGTTEETQVKDLHNFLTTRVSGKEFVDGFLKDEESGNWALSIVTHIQHLNLRAIQDLSLEIMITHDDLRYQSGESVRGQWVDTITFPIASPTKNSPELDSHYSEHVIQIESTFPRGVNYVLTNIEGRETYIGRTNPASHVDIALDTDKTVSRNHGRIVFKNGNYVFYDSGISSNGTLVNGIKVDGGGFRQLKDGDVIRFGNEFSVFRFEQQPDGTFALIKQER